MRIASSPRRDSNADAYSAARFAHAISSTASVAAASTSSGVRASATSCSRSGTRCARCGSGADGSDVRFSRSVATRAVHAGRQTSDDAEHVRATALIELRRRGNRNPQLSRLRIERDGGGIHRPGRKRHRRHHPDDRVGLAAEPHDLADDVAAAAVALLPERRRQDDDPMAAGPLIGGQERRVPASGGCPASRSSWPTRARRARTGAVRAVEREAGRAKQRERREDVALVAPGGVARAGHARGLRQAVPLGLLPDKHQPRRIVKRQRAPQDGAGQAEGGRRGGNRRGQRHGDGQREHRSPARVPQGPPELVAAACAAG